MILFKLRRYKDVTGLSGAGYVAEGWVTSYGEVHLRWYGPYGGDGRFEKVESMLAIHGHGGHTVMDTLFDDGIYIKREGANV